MENKKNTLTIILIVIIAILCCVIGWLLGSKFADVENDVVNNSNNTEEKIDNEDIDLDRVIICDGKFLHQYGEGTNEKKYIFSDNVLKSLESITKYDFGTEEFAKNMNIKMNSCGLYSEEIDCDSNYNGQYVTVRVNIVENDLNNISEYTKYKNLTIDDVLNNNITDNNIFNNQDITCIEQK